ncbi:hypothetical protein NS226_03760 [Aureimonas ureilytica]|uniref:Uncharacterized protein n=1 Tax=Aureimonas ureilytica TaxID=401562 RepID=A0A175RCF7_9HYPH|nr:hypothetical protein [Aureimonas ureilytica]KTQ97767.1 hypothetical protein NS226_03760 [Aureimonas ureilytica]
MKIDFTATIRDLEDKPLKREGGEGDLTLADVCIMGMLTPADNDLSGAEKARRFGLALRIKQGEEDWTVEDLSTLKASIGAIFTPLVVGRSWALLDPR